MWKLIVRAPNNPPKVYHIRSGSNVIGRSAECDIVVDEVAASRRHAEIIATPDADKLILNDLESRNGTFVNHLRIEGTTFVTPKDTIRIGNCVLHIEDSVSAQPPDQVVSGTHPLTREVLLEALDQQAVMIFEASRQLNSVFDIPTTLQQVTVLMQQAMGADHCDFILAEHFDKLRELSLPETIAHEAIELRSTVMLNDVVVMGEQQLGWKAQPRRIRTLLVIPVISGEDLLGLIYTYKNSPTAQVFDRRDLQLAVSISHQAALTIQRSRLIQERDEFQLIHNLLARSVAPEEAERLLGIYLRTGALPGVRQQNATIVYTELLSANNLVFQLGIERFGELVAQFQDELTRAVVNRHGLVHFNGLVMVAVFDEALVAQSSQERAVRAGFEILQQIHEIEQTFKCSVLGAGIGIATGTVTAGFVGGALQTRFFIEGDAVTLAQQLHKIASGQRLMLDPSTCTLVQDRFRMHEIGEYPIPGRAYPLAIYEALSPTM